MYITNISNLKFNIKTYSTSFKKGNVTSSISNANNFDLYDRALSSYNQINFMGKVSISKEELEKYIIDHPEENQREIAEHFKVSVVTIIHLIKAYELKYEPHYQISNVSKEDLEKYIKKHPTTTLQEMADYFGVCSATIYNHLQKTGVKYQKIEHKTSISEKELREYVQKHPEQNQREIANYFNVTVQTLRNLFRRFNIKYTPKGNGSNYLY